MLPLHKLRCPLDASRFLFSFLSSLYVCVGEPGKHSLLNLLSLLETMPDSLSSLRRLHLGYHCRWLSDGDELAEVTFSSLARLQVLTHCRISLMMLSPPSCSSLVSTLSSMQSLTFLDLGGSKDAWRLLLPLLCTEAATPLLLRLQTLLLPRHYQEYGQDAPYDVFLCRLSSLPAPSALQRFCAASAAHRAAGLLSVFSLPHLTLLNVGGGMWTNEFCAFATSFSSAAAPLVSLIFPNVWVKAEDDGDDTDDGDRDEAAVAEEAATLCKAARQLFFRLPALRDLRYEIGLISRAVALPSSLPEDASGGCSASLYRLTLKDNLPRFPFAASPSFPQLTELVVDDTTTEADLELLVAGCPQLLVLDCTVWRSWQIVLVAARCCPRLLDLTVVVRDGDDEEQASDAEDERQVGDAEFTEAEPSFSRRFLPELMVLRLSVDGGFSFSAALLFRHFTASPPAQLQRVVLDGTGLTAEQLVSLAQLPRLFYLDARHAGAFTAEVEEAWTRMRQQLSSRRSEDDSERDPRKIAVEERENCEGGVAELQPPPLGPHQQKEMRQRVLKKVEASHHDDSTNLLASVEGVHHDTVRAVFFAELRSVIAAGARAGDGEVEGSAAAPLSREQ